MTSLADYGSPTVTVLEGDERSRGVKLTSTQSKIRSWNYYATRPFSLSFARRSRAAAPSLRAASKPCATNSASPPSDCVLMENTSQPTGALLATASKIKFSASAGVVFRVPGHLLLDPNAQNSHS